MNDLTEQIKQNWKTYLLLGIILTPFLLTIAGHKSMSFLWEDKNG